jgi:hypothetical protein
MESTNASALADFNEQLNQQANVLDYLISFSTNLAINSADNVKLQASTLAKFTQSTNQLTRNTLVNNVIFFIRMKYCHDL